MMQRKSLYILLISSFFLVSFISGPGFAEEKKPPIIPIPPSVKKLIVETMKSVKSIDMEAFKAAIDNKEDVPIIDVRVPSEYKTGHVPDSINIPRGLLEFFVWGKVVGYPKNEDTSKKIYLYCKTGVRAAFAAKSLEDLGFTNAILVKMKMAEWTKAGYPVEK